MSSGRLWATKKQQRWLGYAGLPHLKTVLAYTLWARTDDTLKRLLTLIELWNMALYYLLSKAFSHFAKLVKNFR